MPTSKNTTERNGIKTPAIERTPAELADEYIARLAANPKDVELGLADYTSKVAHNESQLEDFAYEVHSRLVKLLRPAGPDEGDREAEHKVAHRLWEAQALCKMLAAYAPDIEDALNDSVALNQCSLDVQNAANAIGVLLDEADDTFHELDIEPRPSPAVTEGSAK